MLLRLANIGRRLGLSGLLAKGQGIVSMAVSKPERSDSSLGGRMWADAAISAAPPGTAKTTAREHETPVEAFDSDARIWAFNLRLMRWGAALLVALEMVYFVLDIFISPPMTPAILALHASAAGFSTLVLALTMSKWFERNWRPLCFANLLAIYGLTLGLRLLTGEIAPLFITVVFTLIGAGALLRWSARWQAGLSAIALSVAAWAGLMRGSVAPPTIYQYLSVALAIILGHFILAMRERHRAELSAWMDRLRTSRQVLTEALAESAAIMAEREIAERRLREGEVMLRTVFDSAPDNIAITRMSDGATLEVNREFLKTGYTREEILGVAAVQGGPLEPPSAPRVGAPAARARQRAQFRSRVAQQRRPHGAEPGFGGNGRARRRAMRHFDGARYHRAQADTARIDPRTRGPRGRAARTGDKPAPARNQRGQAAQGARGHRRRYHHQ